MAEENLVFLREARDLLRKGLDKLDKLSTHRVSAMRETEEADLSILREIEAQGEETRAGLKMLLRELARGELDEEGILTVARVLNLPNEDGYLCEAHRLSLRRIGVYLRDKDIRERMQEDLRQMDEKIRRLEEEAWRNSTPRAAEWAKAAGFHVTQEEGTGVAVATYAVPANGGTNVHLEFVGDMMRLSLLSLHNGELKSPVVYRDLTNLYKAVEPADGNPWPGEFFLTFLIEAIRSESAYRGESSLPERAYNAIIKDLERLRRGWE